ncbi:MAG TPA: hypothetical protein ENG48_02655 [Candidatus Atribacteria bacterium]|nr:hypothetical protein [Candidatus Atribacteria bacterium]
MKKLLIFLLMAVLLAGTISAFEFDNIKSYDHFKKEVTIKNAFGLGKDIAKIKLNTPLVYRVPRGYQKVAEIKVTSYKQLKILINDFELYDLKRNNQTISRRLDLKLKKYKDKEVETYGETCFKVLNKTTGKTEEICNFYVNGTKIIKEPYWVDFNINEVKINEPFVVGLFTDVKKGDKVEWIPIIQGVRINEWATWEEGPEIVDATGNMPLFDSNWITEQAGMKIYVHPSANVTLVRATLHPQANCDQVLVWDVSTSSFIANVSVNAATHNATIGINLTAGHYYYVTAQMNGTGNTHQTPYSASPSYPYNGQNVDVTAGVQCGQDVSPCSETTTRIKLIQSVTTRNLTYLVDAPVVNLNYPVDYANLTVPDVDFSCYVSDPSSLSNVSLIIDGSIDQTNSSGINDINYTFSKTGLSEGNHNWTCTAYGDDGESTTASARHFNVNTTPIITISSPVSNTNYPTSNIWFNATSQVNVDYWVINYNGTNITIDDQSGTSLSKLLNVNDGTYNLTIYANNSNTGVWGVNNSVKNFMVDVNPPTISVTSPTGTYDYLYEDYNLTLNTTITDTNLDTCWYSYNGENKTFSCSSGVLSTEYFNYTKGVNNLIVYANDTFGRENSTSVSWDYSIFQDNITYNSETLVTNTETFSIGVTSDSSLTNVYLVYNGTEFTTTKDGGTYTSTVDISNSYVGTQQFRFKFNYGGNIYYSPYYNQTVSDVLFTICNATYNVPFINFTFKDEDSNDYTTAEISSATFEYWIDSKDVSKTYNYINTTNKSFYAFCFSHSDKTLNVDMRVAYKNDESPQRVYDPTTMQLTNQTTNKTLYLLKSIDGSYAYFVVYDSNGNSLDGVSVKVTRVISGETILIGQGETDDSGAVNFFINPDVSHTYTFSKEGYSSKILTLTIADSTVREVFLEGGEVTQPDIYDYGKGISINILVVPTNTTINSGIESSNDFLRNNTWYNFTYTISSSYWDLEDWGFTLKYWNGTRIDFVHSTSSSGGTLKVTADTSNQTRIIMEYYYVVNNTYINKTKSWVIYTESPFGISQVVGRANTYLEANLFGFLGNDNGLFGKALLSVVVLVLMVGGLTYRYGMRADVFALGTIFATLLFLNAMNFIPNPDFLVGKGVTLGNFLIYLTGIIIIGFIFKEEMR